MIRLYNKKGVYFMKKVLFVLAALSMVACEKEEKATETVAADVVTGDSSVVENSVDVAESATPDVVVSEPDAVTGTSEVTPTK